MSRLKTFKDLRMTPFLEEIQDRLSSHIGMNRKAAGIGVLSWAGERKGNGGMASSHLLEFSALLIEFTPQTTPKAPPKLGDQTAQGNSL